MDFSERIKLAKTNVEKDNAKKEMEKQNRLSNYRKQLKALTPRINKLMSDANSVIANGFYDFLDGDSSSSFFSEGWAHKVGFIKNLSGGEIEFMGIINGGYCGDHDFHTNGERAFMTTKWYGDEESSMDLKESDVERFLKEFDDFETRFYKSLDKFLVKNGA